MKVLIVSPIAALSPHLETELEIAQRHLDAGDEVVVMSCRGELPGCDFNLAADPKRCDACRSRRDAGWRLVEPRASHASLGPRIRYPYASSLPTATSESEALTAWRPGQADLGWGVLSTIISATLQPRPNLRKHRWLMFRLAAAAERVFHAVGEFLTRSTTDRVYIFNGRMGNERAVVRACERAGVEYVVHERACNVHHYGLFPNCLLHDIHALNAMILEHWGRAADDPARDETAHRWFRDQVERVQSSWHVFTKDQERDRLPAGWDSSRHNVVFFTSSGDELESISDVLSKHKLYGSQAEGLRRLIADVLAGRDDARITIRIHPHEAGRDSLESRQMLGMGDSRVTVIAPESKVDTYALMRAASVVVTFGSTVGIEAAYWGKPSVLLGPSFYQSLNAAVRPRSHTEAVAAILAPSQTLDRMAALPYGYWAKTHGERFRYFEPDGLFGGTFKGAVIRAAKPRLLQRINWWWGRLIRHLREGGVRYAGQ